MHSHKRLLVIKLIYVIAITVYICVRAVCYGRGSRCFVLLCKESPAGFLSAIFSSGAVKLMFKVEFFRIYHAIK